MFDKHGSVWLHRRWQCVSFLGLVASVAVVVTASAAASQGLAKTASALKACGYMTSTAGGSSIENIKFSDTKASGTKGTFVFKGPGVAETKHLTFAKSGLAFTSFAVAAPGTEMIKVSVATKPMTVATFHFTLQPTTGDVASKVGCTPR
jgi:hypothetical protein